MFEDNQNLIEDYENLDEFSIYKKDGKYYVEQRYNGIYEVTEDMSGESMTYYSNTSFAHGDELANYTFYPRPKTKSNVDDDSLTTAVIRIPINNSLGDKFINDEMGHACSPSEGSRQTTRPL